jgi:hypothetical protein
MWQRNAQAGLWQRNAKACMKIAACMCQASALSIMLDGPNYSTALAADISPRTAISLDTPSLPAVDGFNAKVSGFGGASDGRALYGGEGSITVPLGHQFGLQVDGLVAGFDSERLGSVTAAATAVHLFWRDPNVGLIGAYGHYFHADAFRGVNHYAGAAAGALYLGRVTLEGVAGAESGEVDLGVLGRRNIDTRFFDVAHLAWYATDNLKLSVGHSYVLGRHAVLLGAELGLNGVGGTMASLYASGSVNEGGNATVLGGLRVYFCQRDKTLIRRHREDDPIAYHSPGVLSGIAGPTGCLYGCDPGDTNPLCCH